MLIDGSGGYGALIGLWDSLVLKLVYHPDAINTSFRILAHLDNTNAISTSFSSNSWWLGHVLWLKNDYTDEFLTSLRRWMNFLKAEDYDFEQKYKDGFTWLRRQLGGNGVGNLEMARLLLEFGANVHATVDDIGIGTL